MFYRILKRMFDCTSAALAILLTAPLWLVIVIGIKLSSKGPVFYKAIRAGKDQKPFTLYKFRSMHVYHPDQEGKTSEGGFIANEKRIFPFGALLRKSKLDELPQLLNILLGDMSVIGPRPLSVKGAELHYGGEYRVISDVRPGLSCLDSLFDYAHGELFVKTEEEFREKVLPVRTELARLYVERRSVGLDLYCLFRTPHLIFQIAVLKKKEFSYTKYETEAQKIVFGSGSMK